MSLFYFSGKWLILILFLVCVGAGIVARTQSSRGSIAPTNTAFNKSYWSYVPALIFSVNGSKIKLKSLLEIMLLAAN